MEMHDFNTAEVPPSAGGNLAVYRVTYMDQQIRECVINAESAEAAEVAVREAWYEGKEHMFVDVWTCDWEVEKLSDNAY